jgi:hypothetical protein
MSMAGCLIAASLGMNCSSDDVAAKDANDGGAGAPGAGGTSSQPSCDTVRNELLGAVDNVSSGEVEDISEEGTDIMTLRVDASAGGSMAAAMNPYIYVSLTRGTRIDVTDVTADESADWDLALKRDNIRSNGGDSGPGDVEVAAFDGADFDALTLIDARVAPFAADDFMDEDCEPIVDAIGKPRTRFDGWYTYDAETMELSPAPKVFLLRRSAGGAVYKLQVVGYYQELENGDETVHKSGVYTLRIAAL